MEDVSAAGSLSSNEMTGGMRQDFMPRIVHPYEFRQSGNRQNGSWQSIRELQKIAARDSTSFLNSSSNGICATLLPLSDFASVRRGRRLPAGNQGEGPTFVSSIYINVLDFVW